MIIQREINAWMVIQMYCPNCGTLNNGYQDQDGKHHFQCGKCGVAMVRYYKNRRHDLIEVTIPRDRERLSG